MDESLRGWTPNQACMMIPNIGTDKSPANAARTCIGCEFPAQASPVFVFFLALSESAAKVLRGEFRIGERFDAWKKFRLARAHSPTTDQCSSTSSS